ncbi:hypothetical protein M406DRAFT_32824 [Cryphonectria parasitica EP155]|uniref:S-adenosyl-L-methionine-dependent N-methyltransferase n=1 Tax=Cryphonectria parasitica (strain ATCC 38755 / EP155) TaxID=660469 RepID=A0A9P4YAH6_CRYP1|nr:uncharacterized protein M406DRAFT_32824 [Cryphonectria parasitica EP155]KAF3769424.1 hypothetical protein M406DRAFT_32824 [Cryphonectria parasitica EP155]
MSSAPEWILHKSLLVVGPKRSTAGIKDLVELRTTITTTPDLAFLAETIKSLEDLWPAIAETIYTDAELDAIDGRQILGNLWRFFEQGDTSAITGTGPCHNNVLLDVLTILFHVVDFWRLATTEIATPLFACSSRKPTSELHDIQGFCLGFLTAAAVSSSTSKAEFEKHVATVLRIAVCIGALVDLDAAKLVRMYNDHAAFVSVGWTSQDEYNELNRILEAEPDGYITCITDTNRATVTIREQSASTFKQRLSASGLSAQTLHLQGRYHHRPAYEDGVRRLKELFHQDSRFQLPNAVGLALPLRSNVEGQLILDGALHEVALESILLDRCQWYETVRQAAAHSQVPVDDIVRVGAEATIPRSLTKNSTIPKNNKPSGYHKGATHDHEDGATSAHASAVAVIGMACRYPDADSLEEFWELLNAGMATVRRIPSDRFEVANITRNPKVPFWGNFLQHPDVFDHRFFGISGREAKYMDPQQRLALQVAYEALESAGYFGIESSPEKFPDDVGCFLGVGSVDYADNIASHDATAFSALGTLRAFISGRVSHHFGWTGPSITYDTACSSGAVAIHSAVNAIKNSECSMAVAGGVHVITSPSLYQNLAAASFLSPTGASKAFDASANGYCRGEGAGLVVLKSLERARADGDSILAVITGSAVNQGGNCTPITVPVSSSQNSLYLKALSMGGTDPKEVSFVEAHGTGTAVGDPIECESIRSTFGGPDRAHTLFLGSVKDNIGHTEASSGAAALIKTILMLQKRIIPKQANFRQLNAKIPALEPDHMVVPQRSQPWDVPRRIAVVNNYGAAGSNAAIVVQDVDRSHSTVVLNGDMSLFSAYEVPFFISARTPESLREYCKALKASLAKVQDNYGDRAALGLAYNLSVKQNRRFQYRYSFTASNLKEVASKLSQARPTDIRETAEKPRPVVLCIGGQNGRTVHLDEGVFRNSKLLRDHLNECDRICQNLGLPSLYPTIFSSDPVEDLIGLHCMLFALQYASAKSWLDCGLIVDMVVGHSFGQLTALVVAGVLSLSDGLRFISERARLIQSSWGQETGAMLSVQGERGTVDQLLERAKSLNPSLTAEVACFNGPETIVLAGDQASIDAVEEVAKSETFGLSLKAVRLKNTHAFHSSFVDDILPALREVAATLDFKTPSIRIEACSEAHDWNQGIDAEMLIQHSRKPVYFHDAAQRIVTNLGPCVVLEAGSASPIVPMFRRALAPDEAKKGHTFQPIDIGSSNALGQLARATSNLWAAGVNVQYWAFHRGEKDRLPYINLPPYQFQRNKHWLDYIEPRTFVEQQSTQAQGSDAEPRLLPLLEISETTAGGSTVFRINTLHDMFEVCTKGHAVLGQSLCPASMYIEMAIRAATLRDTKKDHATAACVVKNLKISSPLSVVSTRTTFLRLDPSTIEPDNWEFTILSRDQPIATASAITHATGVVSLVAVGHEAARTQFIQRLVGQEKCDELINSQGSQVLNGNIIYQVFGQVVDYAPYYRRVASIVSRAQEAVGIVNVLACQPPVVKEGSCDPVTLDNFLQVAGIHTNCLSERSNDEVFVCTELGELFISSTFLARRREVQTYRVFSSFSRRTGEKKLVNDIFVFDHKTGDLVVLFLGAIFQGVSSRSLARTLAKLNSGTISTEASGDHIMALPKYTKTDAKNVTTATGSRHDGLPASFGQIQGMLGNILGVSTDEIEADTRLSDLGIDSLMATEVLSEIKKAFDVTILADEFQDLHDVQAIVTRIQGSSPSSSGRLTPSPSDAGEQVDGVAGLGEAVDDTFLSAASYSFQAVRQDFDGISKELEFSDFYTSVYPAQMELVVAYIVEAFQNLGCSLAALAPGDKVTDLPVLDKHAKVKSQIYKILEEVSVLKKDADGGFVRGIASVPSERPHQLQQAIVANFPQHAFEHNLLASTGEKLADCLTGRTDPLGILFGNAKARTLMENVYTHAPMFKAGTVNLARYLVRLFQTLQPSNRPIRILELGAGTGGTTKHLVDSLVATQKPFEYTFTDLSSSLVAQARKKFAQHDFMRYAVLNIEQDPEPAFVGQYDIVLSTNCIHATKDLTRSCTNIRTCLRPNGVLCLVELTRNIYWFDLVFGLLEGWWLFEDGREHALADEKLWKAHLGRAGFRWTDWTVGTSRESNVLRVITASPSDVTPSATIETVTFKRVGNVSLEADIYYPEKQIQGSEVRPIALMIHGGGHVMLSRKDVRPSQTRMLLEAGFLPVSIDYRLCPEMTLIDGPMQDVCDALAWARTVLPQLSLRRRDIVVDGDRVAAVGWSTGGHLALTLGFTAPARGIRAPDATLAFYCPSDYHDAFWSKPNFPFGQGNATRPQWNILDGVEDHPITAYNPPPEKQALGGWMSPSDARSRIALHMNWTGRSLRVLLNGLSSGRLHAPDPRPAGDGHAFPDPTDELLDPSPEQIQLVSPLAQIQRGTYQVPTFLIHGTKDDLIPWQQALRTHEALQQQGVESHIRILDGAAHLFDLYRSYNGNKGAKEAVRAGYDFLRSHVHSSR